MVYGHTGGRLSRTTKIPFLLVLAMGVAACVTPSRTALDGVTFVDTLAFSPRVLVDGQRPGGEPMILASSEGVLLMAAHPGYTHFSQPDAGIVVGTAGELPMWRSTDGGTSWTYVGLAVGVRNAGIGLSDPDLTRGPDGTLYAASLWGVDISVFRSHDNGATWPDGQIFATRQPTALDPKAARQTAIDREWLAGGQRPHELFLSWRGAGGVTIAASTDDGETWPRTTQVHVSACATGKLQVDPATGDILQVVATADGIRIAVSSDSGQTFRVVIVHDAPRDPSGCPDGNLVPTLTIDATGNYVVAWSEGTKGMAVFATSSSDRGATWSVPTRLSEPNTTAIFPWAAASRDGRVAVAWLTSRGVLDPSRDAGSWQVEMAAFRASELVDGTIARSSVTSAPVHEGTVCLHGTNCAAEKSDRRMGDMLSVTATDQGKFILAVADTTMGGGVSHPAFASER